MSNESYDSYLNSGYLYTAKLDSVCGVELDVGENYILTGRVYEGKPRVNLCNLVMRASEVTKRQRKGFKGLYAKGCMCEVILRRLFGISKTKNKYLKYYRFWPRAEKLSPEAEPEEFCFNHFRLLVTKLPH